MNALQKILHNFLQINAMYVVQYDLIIEQI
jgi:hypothetical protein